MEELFREIIQKYRQLRSETDQLVTRLERQHRPHMQCRQGCDQCCMDYRIFPVEFYAIAEELKGVPPQTEAGAGADDCIFLINHACTIYASRPFICRTHGLPLLYANDDGEWELSACELNFTEFDGDFHARNTFPQDRFNSRLFMLNKEFITLPEFSRFGEFDLLPLRDLAAEIK